MNGTRKGIRRSIQSKLTAMIVGVTLVVLGCAFGFVAASQVSSFRRDLVTSGRLISRAHSRTKSGTGKNSVNGTR